MTKPKKNYEVITIQTDDNDFFWCVEEVMTGHSMEIFLTSAEAFDYARFMNFGGAFDGFTPAFMVQKHVLEPKKKEEINEKFGALFKEA